MKIVADENIPFVQEAFGTLGDVTVLPGREIGPEQVRDADLLLVRSVTAVGAKLLEGSRVRFVGSATIGLDHVDEAWLRTRGIVLAYAPGSNANSVAEYVVAALVALREERCAGRTLGIVGLGRIGTLVRDKARALGMAVLANDPPLERAGKAGLVSLEGLLKRSDIVTCHVPLIREGPDATAHLLDASRLLLLRPHAAVINTSRGAVVDNAALLRCLQEKRLGGAVLDVWEGEPQPDPALVRAVTLGTPHIAGHSWNGKAAGTKMLYDAACTFFNRRFKWAPPTPPGGADRRPVAVEAGRSLDEVLRELVPRFYDIRRDDAALRAIAELPDSEQGRAFDHFRASYPARLEFRHTSVAVPAGRSKVPEALRRIGFTVL
ncbi:MAG: 4-phosphoerythronate dehydrogenase [Nitrospiraceae bacterium]|nr:MAG: 4-phosphoerythronate dehydrogenase [Nitrospiraceae bacterium]